MGMSSIFAYNNSTVIFLFWKMQDKEGQLTQRGGKQNTLKHIWKQSAINYKYRGCKLASLGWIFSEMFVLHCIFKREVLAIRTELSLAGRGMGQVISTLRSSALPWGKGRFALASIGPYFIIVWIPLLTVSEYHAASLSCPFFSSKAHECPCFLPWVGIRKYTWLHVPAFFSSQLCQW